MRHLFKHTIKIFGAPTHNEFNEEVWSSGSNWKGRFTYKNKLFLNDKGEQIQADGMAYIERDATGLVIGTKIQYGGQDYRVIGLKTALDDLANLHHYEVWLQRWQNA